MIALHLPKFNIKLKTEADKTLVFDPIRKKYIILTPEEWVRQHFVNYLITEKGYPQGLIANEMSIKLNGTSKRCDTVIYNKKLQPEVIVEYKASTVAITQMVFEQIVRYNMVLHVKYLIVSNGIKHFCCSIDYETQTFNFLSEIPKYEELK